MEKHEFGRLLSCSICGEALEYFGKKGVMLQTRCPICGPHYAESEEEKLPPATDPYRGAQVYYKNRGRDSAPPV